MAAGGARVDIAKLGGALDDLIRRVIDFEHEHANEIAAVAPAMRASARNLIHYLAVRQIDLRPLQDELRNLGLSSLGRLEPCVLGSLASVRAAVRRLAPDAHAGGAVEVGEVLGFDAGAELLEARAASLFGAAHAGRKVRIMVTLPSEAASDPALIDGLVDAGMDVMRINSAHDDERAWRAMIAHLRAAERKQGRCVRISLDLAGPKLRTGPPAQTLGVAKLRPKRGLRGEVIRPCAIDLAGDPRLPLPNAVRAALASGDVLEVRDARGRWRRGAVSLDAGAMRAAFDRTLYVESGAEVRLRRGDDVIARGLLGELPPVEVPLRLARGDRLRLLRSCAAPTADGPCVACTLPEALARVAVGQAVWFDDGRIGGRVVATDADGVDVEVHYAAGATAALRAGKGINLPDTEIDLPALTRTDLDVLAQLARDVDLVGMSFIRKPADVLALHEALERAQASAVGVVLKIETRQAFDHLPQIILAAMRRGPFAVMVARGDLAVEVGFERLAEVQEEMLWLCEAAHVPVIWATQVLEEMAQRGAPSRAEVTDAAMSERAECVMLNKGPFVTEAVRLLDGVLRRMQEHQYKKRPMLRRLHVSQID